MESYNCPLPEEIITDILSRLPAESVSSLKHVCKTWRNLLVDPNFARIHQEFHANRGDTGACNNYKHLTVASRFGYLPSTNEYKVVRIYYEWKDETTLGKVGKVQVYTFGGENGSSKNCGQWRDICDIDYNFEHLNGVYFNGALHWLDHSHSDRTRIMAFDLAMEEFFVVKSPPDIDNFYQLCLLGGYLAIYRNNGSYFPESRRWDVSWHIWVLKKTNQNMMSYVIKENEEYYDSSWRWSRIFSVDHAQLSNFECQPLGVTNSGEILFKYCERSALCIYNPKTETFEEISCGINWKPREKHICLFHHVNTFVSPKGMT
ncbi:F-box/kelch-repeat protein At3g06240-like [Papaver somniferum]|uniref:F-box/kelch-repeat protein At3g06240-like n=1 Tax=Papaver somniferum TaxID=3469 RepID=UPI000E6FFE0A|nr:F-box/kelch-repeat protein At3g06240-like [Papaver somniferum]